MKYLGRGRDHLELCKDQTQVEPNVFCTLLSLHFPLYSFNKTKHLQEYVLRLPTYLHVCLLTQPQALVCFSMYSSMCFFPQHPKHLREIVQGQITKSRQQCYVPALMFENAEHKVSHNDKWIWMCTFSSVLAKHSSQNAAPSCREKVKTGVEGDIGPHVSYLMPISQWFGWFFFFLWLFLFRIFRTNEDVRPYLCIYLHSCTQYMILPFLTCVNQLC